MTTPVTPFFFEGSNFYVKRDDLISNYYPGNKYRKLFSLIHTESSTFKNIISYGGSQSNAMIAIAYLAREKDWNFTYYLKTLPSWLKKEPVGNLKMAINLGMNIIEISHDKYKNKISTLKSSAETIVVSQGGAEKTAKEGIQKLASEIISWKIEKKISKLYVVTPSGTGTTALYLANSLKDRATVLTTPLVGDEKYLKDQWEKLSPNHEFLPQIINTEKKYTFAKPYKEYLTIWNKLNSSGIEFDLIYAPKMWITLLDNLPKDGEILYIHSGGNSGNPTQVVRYDN